MRLFKAAHFVISAASFYIAWIQFYTLNGVVFDHRYSLYLLIAYMGMILVLNRIYNSYEVEYERISSIVFSQTLTDGLTLLIVYLLVSLAWHHMYNVRPFIVLIFIQGIFNILWSKGAHDWFYKHMPKYRTVVIYRNNEDRHRIREVENYYRRFEIIRSLRNPKDIIEIQRAISDAEMVLVAGVDATLRNGIIKQCVEDDIQCFFAPHIGDIIVESSQHEKAFSTPVMRVKHTKANYEYELIKRLGDIILSLFAIIILSPLLLITAFVIFAYDRHSPIYRQTRLTKGGREFDIIKFRSMTINAEPDGVAVLASENDERITPVGKVIRACRIDELPQLFNILKGDMSIVGPRPERPEIATEYAKKKPEFNLRLKVKAGLTGYAQIYGKYNTTAYEKLEMDLLYINKMSVLTDIMLMFATIKILFSKDSTEGVERKKD